MRFGWFFHLPHGTRDQISNLIEHVVALIPKTPSEERIPFLSALRFFAAWSRLSNVDGVVLNSVSVRPCSACTHWHPMAARNYHNGKECSRWIWNYMHRAVKWRVTVVLHDAIDQILAITIENCRPAFCFNDASIRLYQSKSDKPTTVIGDSEYSLCERCFVVIRMP